MADLCEPSETTDTGILSASVIDFLEQFYSASSETELISGYSLITHSLGNSQLIKPDRQLATIA